MRHGEVRFTAMCMRPFAWGGMLLVAVVAFVSLTGYRTLRHQPPRPASILVDVPAHSGELLPVSARGPHTPFPLHTKSKSRRGEDLKTVIYEKPVVGIDFTPPEAFERAVE